MASYLKRAQVDIMQSVIIVAVIVGVGLLVYFLFFAPGKNVTENENKIVVNFTELNFTRVYYPNKTLTPGMIMSSNVTEICITGYSTRVRNVSEATKKKVYNSYGLSENQPTGAYQVDHLINLGLGGSNDVKNLWPQPSQPKPGYKEKDVLENYLRRQVCAGKMDLREAQGIIADDWFKAYLTAVENGGIKTNESFNAVEMD